MPGEIEGKYGGKLNPRMEGEPALPGAGRPKGSLNAKTVISKWLETIEQAKNPISGEQQEMSQMDIITLAQLKKARKGDTSSFNALLDRTEGKPKQEGKLTVDGDLGIQLVFEKKGDNEPLADDPAGS